MEESTEEEEDEALGKEAAAAAREPEWYRISDENVQPSNLRETLEGNPFLIFYERTQPEERSQLGREGGGIIGEEINNLRGGFGGFGGFGQGSSRPRVVESWRLNGYDLAKKEREREREKEKEKEMEEDG